jgi:hypothetical protein
MATDKAQYWKPFSTPRRAGDRFTSQQYSKAARILGIFRSTIFESQSSPGSANPGSDLPI